MNDSKKSLKIYKTSFYNAILIDFIFAAFFAILTSQVILIFHGKTFDYENVILNNYFIKTRQIQLDFAIDFSEMMEIGSFFNTHVIFYAFLICPEGRSTFVTITVLIYNAVNITIDFIL